VLIIKAEVGFRHHEMLLDAVLTYGLESEEYDKAIEIMEHMRSYPDTVFRLWDWGYENILPKEDFELIKPYIRRK
jgi:hypothetical protein